MAAQSFKRQNEQDSLVLHWLLEIQHMQKNASYMKAWRNLLLSKSVTNHNHASTAAKPNATRTR